ncbi:MAG TPA: polyprenyl synthetase family protein [Polyangiaceae bacterium]|jgi:geranylgeranyl diphosphate synthase type II|nr:polyprenyl synthetase family protein [Polyangiaceae bacterium]
MAGYTLRTPRLVAEVMSEYAARTRESMLAFLPDREPRRYLYDLIREYPRRGGRGMRPAICIATARAHGADLEQALHTATFIELLHNALLVLDDIQDESEERRGRATLHQTHGTPIAINVGSTMSILSLVPLLQNLESAGPWVSLRLFERAIEVARLSAEGQSLELGWRLDNVLDLDESDYLDLVLKKTCAYSTVFPMRAGVMIARRSADAPLPTLRYAFLLGAAFQIQDDILNIAGDHRQYGKELAGDLLEGKRTLLTTRLMQCGSPSERERVTAFLGAKRSTKSEAQLADMLALLDKYDCVEYARRFAQGLVGAALHEFAMGLEPLPPSRDKEFLRGLSTWIIEQT